MSFTTGTLDATTYEILRHRLLTINDEQSNTVIRTSGSPIVYEAKDFNTAIMNPDGDGLFIGTYMPILVGLPDQERQEVVAAFVALRDDWTPSDELKRELQQFAKRELAPYKYPRRVEFVEALPRDDVGKVQPRLLRDAFVPADQRPGDMPVPGHERRSA